MRSVDKKYPLYCTIYHCIRNPCTYKGQTVKKFNEIKDLELFLYTVSIKISLQTKHLAHTVKVLREGFALCMPWFTEYLDLHLALTGHCDKARKSQRHLSNSVFNP